MLAIKVTSTGEAKEIQLNKDSVLEQLQEAVDGWVQAVDLSPTLTMWLNEEGKLNGLPFNPFATWLWEEVYGSTDFIVGDVIFTGGTGEEGETLGLDEEIANKLRKEFMM